MLNKEKQLLPKTILIREALVLDAYARVCWRSSKPALFAGSDQEPGSKIRLDEGGTGMVGFIRGFIPGRVLTFEYTGLLSGHQDDETSPDALSVRGRLETYRLPSESNVAGLSVATDLSETYYSLFNSLRDNALAKIRTPAES